MKNEHVLGEIASIHCLRSYNIPQTSLDSHPPMDDLVQCGNWVITD